MKNYLVIGNPIEHSLSPKLHNYWIKQNNIQAIYKKSKIEKKDLKDLVFRIKKEEINGVNVTVPFKNDVIEYLDQLSPESQSTQSVNTIFLMNDKVVGHNTDIYGFEAAIKDTKFDLTNKKVFILGAGGVVPSIIFALNKLKVTEIKLCNRTKSKAENLKKSFKNLKIIDWGEISDSDMIINATSIGLNNEDKMPFKFSDFGKNKFFYDIIYNPSETDFLKKAKNLGNKIENGKKMFIYQAAAAFKIWHKIKPEISEKITKILD